MNTVQFDRYYRYEALTAFLENWADTYPQLCRLDVLGKSYEGRDIWVMTLTNFGTGPADEKPAYWVDGNIHATEVSASTASLYLIHKLLTQYGSDERVTHVLDTRAFYVVPRLNPDGAEWALADNPTFIRSSTKPYPYEDQRDGLIAQDIDGDGRIMQMRVRDPQGNWKPHPDEPMLMIPREAEDLPGGDFYRILPEGMIQNWDGVTIDFAPSKQGLDLNRQFPGLWEPSQGGSGAYAGSEPEPRAAIEFVTSHPNITGSVSFHTFSGVHLRPPTKGPDDTLPTRDLRTYKKIGRKGKELTGYPAIAVYHDFAYDPKTFIRGTFDDWMYEHLGVYAWTTEIWSAQQQAGITDYKYIEWWGDHPVEHDVKIYRWFKENIKADSYVDWQPFEHPQLGSVEIGGWHTMETWRNPPLEVLEKEVAPLADFCIHNLLISPKLELHSVDVESRGTTHYVRLVVENTGWLPTNISEQAMKMKTVKPLQVKLNLPNQAKLVTGETWQFADQLKGRDHKPVFSVWSADSTDNRKKFEWVIEAPTGTEIELEAQHDRAGVVRATVRLE